MRRNPVFKLEVLPEPVELLVRPGFNLDEGVGSGQNPLTATTSTSTRLCRVFFA